MQNVRQYSVTDDAAADVDDLPGCAATLGTAATSTSPEFMATDPAANLKGCHVSPDPLLPQRLPTSTAGYPSIWIRVLRNHHPSRRPSPRTHREQYSLFIRVRRRGRRCLPGFRYPAPPSRLDEREAPPIRSTPRRQRTRVCRALTRSSPGRQGGCFCTL